MYRQGDVLIVKADAIPADAVQLDHCVVALGEATGHQHRVREGAQQWRTRTGEQYLKVLGAKAELVHEEHGTIALPGPAIYHVVHQREFEPTAERSHVPVRD